MVPSEAPAASATPDIPLAPETKQPTTPQRITPAAPPDAENKCPSCSTPLAAADAVLCVNCGYNLKTRMKLSAVVVESDGEDESEDEAADEAAEEEERA